MSRLARVQAKAERYQTRMETAGNQLHALYIIEGDAPTQDANGLPVTAPTPTLVSPAPRVRLGGKLIPGEGGAMVRVGDAEVLYLPRSQWTQERLLAAQGFRIDDPDAGDRYQIVAGTLREAGPSTWRFLLERIS